MNTTSFESRLSALRLLLQREAYFVDPYKHPQYHNVRPLVILLDNILRKNGYKSSKDRDQARLDILGYIVELPNIGSTYDLSIYQCSTIYFYLILSDTHEPNQWAEDFILTCANRAKGTNLQRQSDPASIRPPVSTTNPDLPDMF